MLRWLCCADYAVLTGVSDLLSGWWRFNFLRAEGLSLTGVVYQTIITLVETGLTGARLTA